LLLIFLFILLLSLAPLGVALANPGAEANVLNPNVRVDHEIQVQNGGSIIINDTISLSTNPGENLEPFQSFPMGFPFEYKSYIDYCFAYNASNHERLNLELDTGLGRIGFYGIRVDFPAPVNISGGKSYVFTVTFVLSGLISSNATNFTLMRFPLCPSLTSLNENASSCNVTVFLPPGVTYIGGSNAFNETTVDNSQVLNYTIKPLESYASQDAWISFNSEGSQFLLFNNDNVKREITLDQMGHVHVSDYYYITNWANTSLSSMEIGLPKGAYDVSSYDSIGSLGVTTGEGTGAYTNATVTFRTAVTTGQAVEFTLDYLLPLKKYVNQYSWWSFNLTSAFLENFNWVVRDLTVYVTLPYGAEFERYSESSELEGEVQFNIQQNAFQETLTFTLFNVSSLQDLNFSVAYKYLFFWSSFIPTLWIGIVALAICGVALFWRAPKFPAPAIPVPTDILRGFVDAYEEREKILLELQNMEQQVRKGRIPRRRYKLRKISLQGRLSTLSHNLTDSREKMRKAGPGYANIMRGIEVAETELEGLEEDIRRITARHRLGELSSEAYDRLLEDYHRRSERAQTTIKGFLLRLREEIR
jgi:hypothetical protein